MWDRSQGAGCWDQGLGLGCACRITSITPCHTSCHTKSRYACLLFPPASYPYPTAAPIIVSLLPLLGLGAALTKLFAVMLALRIKARGEMFQQSTAHARQKVANDMLAARHACAPEPAAHGDLAAALRVVACRCTLHEQLRVICAVSQSEYRYRHCWKYCWPSVTVYIEMACAKDSNTDNRVNASTRTLMPVPEVAFRLSESPLVTSRGSLIRQSFTIQIIHVTAITSGP